MSKWASRWPGEYAFKDGPSRRGPDRQHKSTIKPTVALVDHKADDVEKRYREIRLRQKEIERQRRRSFVMEAQAPPKPPSPAKPRLPPGHGREPQRVQRMRKLFNSAITDAVSLCLRRCVSRLERKEERRIFLAKVAAGRVLPPVPASSRAVSDALHDLLDPGKKEEAKRAQKEIERLARQREERAARLVEFDAAKEDAADASHQVQKARHIARDLEAAYHHARDHAAANETEELQEEAAAAKKALDEANHEVTELLHHQREQEHAMAKAAHALEACGVSVFHLEQDREEHKKVDAGDEHAKAHQRKTRLKAKFRKAGGMAGLLKSSTHALAEGGKGLIKKKSYLAETMFDALSGDERAWVGASLLLADCLEDVDIRALPCVSAACGSVRKSNSESGHLHAIDRRGHGDEVASMA